MSYNVVFEHTVKAGGYAGVRTWTSYKDKADFEAMNADADEIRFVVAEGVTGDEALNLCSLTPEVCYLTAAVQEMCYADDGHIDTDLAAFHLEKAILAIAENRKHRLANELFPSSSFPFVKIGKENTEKNRLYRFVKKTFTNPNGTIDDLGLAEVLIKLEIGTIVLDRLIVPE